MFHLAHAIHEQGVPIFSAVEPIWQMRQSFITEKASGAAKQCTSRNQAVPLWKNSWIMMLIPADIFAEAIVENGVPEDSGQDLRKSDYSICAVFG